MKRFKRILNLFFAFALTLSMLVCAAPSASAASDPEIMSGSSLLVEKETGTILYSKNENEKVYPASTTKIMTVLLAVEACDAQKVSLEDEITVSETAFEGLSDDGTSAGIKPGEIITFKDLLYCALLSSANEACNIIAEHVSGNVPAFVEAMNSRAMKMGCSGTHFANSHGLPDENHYTTAYDLYLIMASAMDNPLFAEMIGMDYYTVSETNLSSKRELKNSNRLLQKDDQYYYENVTGGKTGYTDAAGFCLVCAAENDELELISVVMNAKSVVLENGETQTQSFTESKRLLQWGFDNFSYRTILSTIDLIADVPVSLGNGADSVILRPVSSITALLDNDIDLESAQYDIVIYSKRDNVELTAPIEQGEPLGEVTVMLNGKNYGTVKLIANTGIDLKHSEYFKAEIKGVFSNKYVKVTIIVLTLLAVLYTVFIINYNIKRKNKRRAEAELAREKIAELRRNAASTVGKSFEEIESIRKRESYK